MPQRRFDRDMIRFRPLRDRANRVFVRRDMIYPGSHHIRIPTDVRKAAAQTARLMLDARGKGKSVMLAFGAHALKNGLGPLLAGMLEKEHWTHLATNGAGLIHDWELAYQGATSEDVRRNVADGCFGLWKETGFWTGLALAAGGYRDMGYAESMGRLVLDGGVEVPSEAELSAVARRELTRNPEKSAAAADLLALKKALKLKTGFHAARHKFAGASLAAAAVRLGVPMTAHPMIGMDIIYCNPAVSGSAAGRAGMRDFLSFAASVDNLDGGGVYVSVGSAVMSPMIFEKSLAMCRNVQLRRGRGGGGHHIVVVDIAPNSPSWKKGREPATTDKDYYLRYWKTFSRMGGTAEYVRADNRAFLLALDGALV